MSEKSISAAGHNWSEWKVQREATPEEKGLKVRLCQNCGKIEEKDIIVIDFDSSIFSISEEGRLTKYKGNDLIRFRCLSLCEEDIVSLASRRIVNSYALGRNTIFSGKKLCIK